MVPVPHPGGMPVDVPHEGLLPGVVHSDRPSRPESQQAGVDMHAQVLLAAERTADSGQVEPDPLRWKTQRRRYLVPITVESLRGHEEIHPVGAGNG